MLKRDFKFKVNTITDPQSGAIEGKLAVYNNVDLGGDVIVPGAFTKTLQGNGTQIPLLWQHQPDQPIGTLTLSDAPDALYVRGQLLLDLPMARNAYALLTNKVIKGLSIGYDVIKDTIENNVRYLKELRLWEGSLVTFPMNEMAQVTAIKSLSDIRPFLQSMHSATDADVVRGLKAVDRELKRLLHKDQFCQCDCPECAAGDCVDCSNPDCQDTSCDANFADVEELAALKAFATSLKALVQ